MYVCGGGAPSVVDGACGWGVSSSPWWPAVCVAAHPTPAAAVAAGAVWLAPSHSVTAVVPPTHPSLAHAHVHTHIVPSTTTTTPPPQEHKHWEDSFKVYERGVALFKFPHARDIWASYLKQFVERWAWRGGGGRGGLGHWGATGAYMGGGGMVWGGCRGGAMFCCWTAPCRGWRWCCPRLAMLSGVWCVFARAPGRAR